MLYTREEIKKVLSTVVLDFGFLDQVFSNNKKSACDGERPSNS